MTKFLAWLDRVDRGFKLDSAVMRPVPPWGVAALVAGFGGTVTMAWIYVAVSGFAARMTLGAVVATAAFPLYIWVIRSINSTRSASRTALRLAMVIGALIALVLMTAVSLRLIFFE